MKKEIEFSKFASYSKMIQMLHTKFIWVKYKKTKFYDTPNSKMKGRKKGKMSRYVTDHGF